MQTSVSKLQKCCVGAMLVSCRCGSFGATKTLRSSQADDSQAVVLLMVHCRARGMWHPRLWSH